MSVNARELIVDILIETSRGEYLSNLVKQVLDKYSYLPEYDRSFIKAVCEGTIERRLTIDYFLDQVSSVKVKKMKPLIRELMRMSVYQLKFMDSVPSSAAINEAVKLAKKRHFNNLAGFVNGVLRNIDRMEMPAESEYPSDEIRYSCPTFVVELFKDGYGEVRAEEMLKASYQKRPVIIRVCRQMGSSDELIEILRSEGVKVSRHPYAEEALIIENFGTLNQLPSFMTGRFTVQDISSIILGRIVPLKEGDTVIDMCAAPGGKSIHIAQRLDGKGVVEARDVSEKKVTLIVQNSERCKVDNLKVAVKDATVFDPTDEGRADVVVADVPCSGLGVIARKSDLKYRITEDDLISLKALQRQIIDNAVKYVKPGGCLIYSTCTVNPNENIKQMEYILETYNFKPESFENLLPAALCGRGGSQGYLQLLQGVDDSDGFFMCRLRKDSNG